MQYVHSKDSSCGVHTVKKEVREHYHGCCRCVNRTLLVAKSSNNNMCRVRYSIRYGLTVTHVCRGSSHDNTCCQKIQVPLLHYTVAFVAAIESMNAVVKWIAQCVCRI